MALARVKSWIAGEVLTASDLNAEFNNILTNPVDLWSPAGKSADMNGFELIMDADADSSLTADTNNRLDVRLGGVDLFVFDATTASCLNGITFTATATGNGPTVGATGETNVAITLKGKGTGRVTLGQATSTDVQLAADQPLTDSSGNEFVKFSKTATAVNEFTVTNAATGTAPKISATGGDTDIALRLSPKGAGNVQFTDGTDTTKVVALALSGLTTATTRTLTVQDKDMTIGAVMGTKVASTSGTSIDFTSIPTWVTRIQISFFGVSTSGTSGVMVQTGDSGGIETAGYLGTASNIAGGGSTTATAFTTGFGICGTTAAASVIHGTLTLTLEDPAAFTWIAAGSGGFSDSASTYVSGGSKSTSAALDRVRITTVGGADTFDAGSINIRMA